MKRIAKYSILLLLVWVAPGCKFIDVLNEHLYRDLGEFNNKIAARNHAIKEFYKNYGTLPPGYYKVKYNNINALPNEYRENALWYNKSEAILALEQDIHSGPACYWEKVDRNVLEKASKAADALLLIDSLVPRPNQSRSHCL